MIQMSFNFMSSLIEELTVNGSFYKRFEIFKSVLFPLDNLR